MLNELINVCKIIHDKEKDGTSTDVQLSHEDLNKAVERITLPFHSVSTVLVVSKVQDLIALKLLLKAIYGHLELEANEVMNDVYERPFKM